MAGINPMIPLASRAADLSQPTNSLIALDRNKIAKARQPYENALLQAQTARTENATAVGKAQLDEQARQKKIMGAIYAYEAIESLKAIPDMDQRKRAHMAFEGQMSALGYDIPEGDEDLSDEGLTRSAAALAPFYQQARMFSGRSGRAVGSPIRVRGADGKEYFQVVRDDGQGGMSTQLLPVEGEFLSVLGETAGEQSQRAVNEAGGKTAATNAADLVTKPPVEREVARARVIGAAEGDAQVGLPTVIANGNYMIETLNKAINHPGLKTATGLSSKTDPRNFTPGTDAFNFNVLKDQIQGQTFLQAYQSLKGGGQITEIEAEKAEDAIARMNTAQSTDAWVEAAEEFIGVINRGVERESVLAGKNAAKQAKTLESEGIDPSLLPYMSTEDRALFQ